MDHKEVRKQIRNVLKEEGSTEITKLAIEAAETIARTKMDHLEKICQEQLGKINQRTMAVQSFIMGEVKNDVVPRLHKTEDKFEALLELLAEAGVAADVLAKLEDKTTEVAKRKQEKAGEEIKQRLEAERAQLNAGASDGQAEA